MSQKKMVYFRQCIEKFRVKREFGYIRKHCTEHGSTGTMCIPRCDLFDALYSHRLEIRTLNTNAHSQEDRVRNGNTLER